MDMNGLLIDYEWCTGCHTCEIACQQEHGFAPRNVLEKGKVGISPYEIGPHDLGNGRLPVRILARNAAHRALRPVRRPR